MDVFVVVQPGRLRTSSRCGASQTTAYGQHSVRRSKKSLPFRLLVRPGSATRQFFRVAPLITLSRENRQSPRGSRAKYAMRDLQSCKGTQQVTKIVVISTVQHERRHYHSSVIKVIIACCAFHCLWSLLSATWSMHSFRLFCQCNSTVWGLRAGIILSFSYVLCFLLFSFSSFSVIRDELFVLFITVCQHSTLFLLVLP